MYRYWEFVRSDVRYILIALGFAVVEPMRKFAGLVVDVGHEDIFKPICPFWNNVNPEVPATFNPPAKVEVAVVEVALKLSATTSPATESLA